MIDFLILYEHKNRELENACLLAAELELRGYKVKIVNIYSGNKYWLNPSVVIVPHLYDESQLISFCDNYKHNNYKILSLQYEQVLRDNQHEGIHNPDGEAVYAQHVAWGAAQKERYLSHGIKEDHVQVVGHIGMDLDRKEFDGFFMTRDEVAQSLSLDVNKKWFLFISTFGYRRMSREDMEAFQKMAPSIFQDAELSNLAQDEIEAWLKKIAENYRDVVVIYRRHPSEREDPQLLQLEKELSNFRCIDDYTIRQWVRVADIMHTWYSTSISDAYYANKMCYIDRPYELPEGFELDIMHGAKFIKSYEEMRKTIDQDKDDYEFPISDDVMSYYYGYNRHNVGKWAFKRLADLCVNILEDDAFIYRYDYKNIGKKYKTSVAIAIKRFCYHCIFNFCTIINVHFNIEPDNKFFNNLNMFSRETYATRKIIKESKKRFKKVITQIKCDV